MSAIARGCLNRCHTFCGTEHIPTHLRQHDAICHTSWPDSTGRLLRSEEGANIKRCVFEKLSTICFYRHHYGHWNSHCRGVIKFSKSVRGAWCLVSHTVRQQGVRGRCVSSSLFFSVYHSWVRSLCHASAASRAAGLCIVTIGAIVGCAPVYIHTRVPRLISWLRPCPMNSVRDRKPACMWYPDRFHAKRVVSSRAYCCSSSSILLCIPIRGRCSA